MKKRKSEKQLREKMHLMHGLRNHSRHDDGGALVKCSVCGKKGLVHIDDKNEEIVCTSCVDTGADKEKSDKL